MEKIIEFKIKLEEAKKLQFCNLINLLEAKERYKNNPNSISPDHELSVIQFKEYARVDKYLVKEAELTLKLAITELITNHTQDESPA